MREMQGRAIAQMTELDTPPDSVVIGYLTPNDEDVCDRCGGDPEAGGGPCTGVATFQRGNGAIALLPWGLCGDCCAKEDA